MTGTLTSDRYQMKTKTKCHRSEIIQHQNLVNVRARWLVVCCSGGKGTRAGSADSRGGFRGRVGSPTSPHPARATAPPMSGPVQPRSADVWGRAGDGTTRYAVVPRTPSEVHASPSRIALFIGAGGGAARYSGARAVLSESGTWSSARRWRRNRPRAASSRCSARRTPIVLHQVLWWWSFQALVGVHLPCRRLTPGRQWRLCSRTPAGTRGEGEHVARAASTLRLRDTAPARGE